MNAFVVSPGQGLIDMVLSLLGGEDGDYSSSLVVFPGKRPSHFLRKALSERIGTSFIPPTIFSMDEFIDSLYDEFSPSRHLETVDAVALLYEIHVKSSNPLGGRGFMTPESFFSLGLKIYRDIEELSIEDVSPERVRQIETLISDGLPDETKDRLQSLSHFYEEFYERIGGGSLSSRSMRYRAVSETVAESVISGYDKAVFAGFFALTQSEKKLFRTLLENDNTAFVFEAGTGLKKNLDELGIRYDDEEKEAGAPEISFYRSPDTHGQVMALGEVLMRQAGGAVPPDEKTVIVLPSSESLFPLLRQGLSDLDGDSYNVSLGYPLYRTPVFGFINNLMDLINSMDGDRVYIPDYLKFVLHPYTKNIYYRGKSDTTRILFHSIEEELLKLRTRTFVTLTELEENERLFGEVIAKLPDGGEGAGREDLMAHLKTIHEGTIVRFSSFENVADFAYKCMDLLVYIFNESTARLHPLFYPFASSFMEALDPLPGSLMKHMAFAERSSYFIFLRRYISTCRTPFTGTPLRGLQVLGFLETRNLKFDRVFVLDANEEILPDTGKEDTLLPLKARQSLGLPTYLDRDRLATHYFDSLIGGAREVHLFFIESDQREPSRFIERLIWERQKKDGNTTSAPYIAPVNYRVKLTNEVPGPIPKTEDMGRFLRGCRYSATMLNRYLKCPLQFYYSTVLALSPKEEASGDIARDDLGSFVHLVLRRFFQDKKGRILKENDLTAAEMDSIVDALFEMKYGSEPAGSLYLLRRQLKRRLREIVMQYYLPLQRKGDLSILEVEEAIEVDVKGLSLRGRLDSVEKRDEAIVIVDFKTGSTDSNLKIDFDKLDPGRRETWAEAIGSLQLPFYLLLYSQKRRRPVDGLNALFLLLGRSRISYGIEMPLFDGSAAEETFRPLRTVILGLLEEINDPHLPFTPAADMKKSCPFCDYRYICGTQWIVK